MFQLADKTYSTTVDLLYPVLSHNYMCLCHNANHDTLIGGFFRLVAWFD